MWSYRVPKVKGIKLYHGCTRQQHYIIAFSLRFQSIPLIVYGNTKHDKKEIPAQMLQPTEFPISCYNSFCLLIQQQRETGF